MVVYQYALWKNLLRASRDAGMPLPIAKRIVPAIVAFWNKGKERIDEMCCKMSRYLKELHWYLAQESPRQALIICEIKKVAVNAFLLKKHCFNSLPKTWFQGKSFSAIRKKLHSMEAPCQILYWSWHRHTKSLVQCLECYQHHHWNGRENHLRMQRINSRAHQFHSRQGRREVLSREWLKSIVAR
jgi:hypothetical protein